jgi:DNA-binding NtrC family response regulator
MLRGESGTGKEVAAQTIHLLSRRRGRPFVAINCGALSPTLIESELFGHEKGSFTGADRRRAGIFETASGGTLFLDEVTEMPAELQVKLLRVLESRSFRRVGGNEDLDTDVRIVSSTNRDVDEAVRKETFRSDLFYRLDVFPIQLPSLRDRPEDVGALARHFLAAIDDVEKSGIRAIEPAAVEALGAHAWPGNVRELRNVLHRCYLLSDPPSVTAETVRQVLGDRRPNPPLDSASDGALVGVRVGDSLAEAEKKLLLATLAHVNGNKRVLAEMLGVSLKTVYNKLREYGAGG